MLKLMFAVKRRKVNYFYFVGASIFKKRTLRCIKQLKQRRNLIYELCIISLLRQLHHHRDLSRISAYQKNEPSYIKSCR